MIREAQSSDLPRIVEMGRHFLKQTSYERYLKESPETMQKLAELLLSKNGLLVAEHDSEITGMIGFILHEHFISGEKMAGEVFWWTEPTRRVDGVKLLAETEKRARAFGAKHMQMIAPNDKVAQFYERLGYEYVESTYQISL